MRISDWSSDVCSSDLLLLDETAKSRGVIAASAGNHAQGLAYHGRRLGIPVTIVMPRPTPIAKVSPTEGHGATVILEGEKFEDAYAHAVEVGKTRSEEHTSELQSLMRISYAVFCLKKKNTPN